MGVNQLFEKPALTPRETGPEMSNLLNILFSRKIAHAYTDKKTTTKHGNINLDRLASFQANNNQSTWLNFSFFFFHNFTMRIRRHSLLCFKAHNIVLQIFFGFFHLV